MSIEKELSVESIHTRNKMLVNILFTASWVRGRWNKVLKPYNISEQQFNVLRILRGQYPKPAMLATIQGRMIDRMSNATRLVDKLEKKELASRNRDPDNRRKVNILITKKGLELLSDLDSVLENLLKDFEHVTDKEANNLSRILDKLREVDDTPEE